MATKKKAAKKKAAKKKTASKKIFRVPSLIFNPRLGGGGDPPPPWLRVILNDAARAKQLQAWVNSVIQKTGR